MCGNRGCPPEAAEEAHRSCLRWRRMSSTRQAMLEELQSSALRCVVEEVQKNRESGRRETPVQKLSLLMAAGRGGDSRTEAPLRLSARRLRR